jgi:hypothetical protein
MTVYDCAVLLILAVWLTCSVLGQRKNSGRLLRYDFLGLIPNCHFFAPKPVSCDISVHVRSLNSEGLLSPWSPLIAGSKGRFCFIWNPMHKLRKALYDLTEMLQRQEHVPAAQHLSFPYLMLLRAVSAKGIERRDVSAIQFVITASAGHEDNVEDVIFLSHQHLC